MILLSGALKSLIDPPCAQRYVLSLPLRVGRKVAEGLTMCSGVKMAESTKLQTSALPSQQQQPQQQQQQQQPPRLQQQSPPHAFEWDINDSNVPKVREKTTSTRLAMFGFLIKFVLFELSCCDIN